MSTAQALAQAIRAAPGARLDAACACRARRCEPRHNLVLESGMEAPTMEHVIALALALPAEIESFDERERELLQRVLRLERELFAGRCACKGCACGTSTSMPSISSVRAPSKTHSRETNMRIAVSGKGGVGKTTIAGTLARKLRRQIRACDHVQNVEHLHTIFQIDATDAAAADHANFYPAHNSSSLGSSRRYYTKKAVLRCSVVARLKKRFTGRGSVHARMRACSFTGKPLRCSSRCRRT